MNIAATIAAELNVKESQVSTALQLLAEGNTVPFIARYRKEATGGWMTPSCAPLKSARTI